MMSTLTEMPSKKMQSRTPSRPFLHRRRHDSAQPQQNGAGAGQIPACQQNLIGDLWMMAVEKRDKEVEEEAKTDDGSPKIKPRPIVQLGIFFISHSPVFSVVFSVVGVLALLLLPLLAKNTYISENALMPGSARSMLSNRDVSDGSQLVKDIMKAGVLKSIGSLENTCQKWVQKFIIKSSNLKGINFTL